MWQLYVIIAVLHGNASFGGPMIVDGFATEATCQTHLAKLKENTPQVFDNGKWIPDGKVKFIHEACIRVDKK